MRQYNKGMRTFWYATVFSLFTLTGYLLAVQSWGGTVFVYLGEKRAPASVRRTSDYAEVPRSALHQSAHAQLAASGSIEKRDGSVGIHLGNPLVRNTLGETDFACKVKGREGLFDHLELTFTGTGISEGGENPKMTVVGPCEGTDSFSELATVWLPMDEITRGKPNDGVFTFDNVKVQLESMPGAWPDSWVLSNVRLFRQSEPTTEFKVDAMQMRTSRPSLISF